MVSWPVLYYSRGIEFCDLPARHRDFKPFGNVGLLHKAEAQLNASYTRGNRSDCGPILIRHPRRFHRRHGDKQYILVQDAVAFGVMRQRERHALGHAAEYDRCARDPKRGILVEVFDEFL